MSGLPTPVVPPAQMSFLAFDFGAKRTGDLRPAAARKAVASRQKPPRIATYTIRRGDTLASIARQFKIDSDDIRRLNRIQPSRLQPGQTLTIRLGDNG